MCCVLQLMKCNFCIKLGHCLGTFCGALNVLLSENNNIVIIKVILLINRFKVC